MWQQKPSPEGLTEEARDISWPETQYHLPQGMTEVRSMLVCHHPLHVFPMIEGWEESRGEPWLISGIFFHSDGILFVSSDRFYFLTLPSGGISSAWTPSLHPVLKYIILPIQICQRLYYICISNLIKSFSGDIFSLKATSNWIFFALLSLSLLLFPGQLHFQIANHSVSREGDHDPQLPSSPPVCRKAWLCISHPGLSSLSILKYLYCHISQVDHCFLLDTSEWNSSCYAPEEGKAERYILVCNSGMHLSSWTLALGICCNKGYRVGGNTFCLRNLCGRQWL